MSNETDDEKKSAVQTATHRSHQRLFRDGKLDSSRAVSTTLFTQTHARCTHCGGSSKRRSGQMMVYKLDGVWQWTSCSTECTHDLVLAGGLRQ